MAYEDRNLIGKVQGVNERGGIDKYSNTEYYKDNPGETLNTEGQDARIASARENTNQSILRDQGKLSLESSIETIDDYREVAENYVMDVLWNKVWYVSSMDGPAVNTTSSSEVFNGATRQSDTSSGKFLSVKRPCRFRCLFYFNGSDATDSTAYIGTAGTFTSDTGLTSINQEGMEYTALKISDGAVTMNTRNADGTTERQSGRTINDDTTYVLEIDFSPRERADYYLDGEYLGSISDTLPGLSDPVTFLPLMVSIQRSGGTNRTVTIESWEFIQLKQ